MSRPAELTFGLFTDEALTIATAQDMADDFQASFNTRWGPLFDSEVSIIPPTVKLGDGSTTPFLAVAAGAGIVGGTGDAFVPPNVAVLLKKTTGVGGRKNRGRTFWPFILKQSNCSENGTVAPAAVTQYTNTAALWLADLLADHQPMVITNKTFNTPLPPHFVTHLSAGPTVTAYSSETLVATQRRRLGR